MPDQAGRREGVGGGWIYEGNTVGAMSCVKARMLIMPTDNKEQNPKQIKGKK